MSIFPGAFTPIRFLGAGLFFLSCLFSINTNSAHLVTTGTFVANFNKAQVSNSGATRKFELVPYIGYGHPFQISGPHYFNPEVALAYYIDTAKKIKKRTVFLKYNFSYILNNRFVLRYGLSTYWYTVSGDGGTVTLRNGSVYKEFPAPDDEVTSYFSTLDLGAEFFFNQARSARLDFNMMNARDFDNRAFNYILTYNWYL